LVPEDIVVLVLVVSASYTTYNYTPVYLSDLAHSASAYLPAIAGKHVYVPASFYLLSVLPCAGVSEHVGHP